MTEKNQLIVPEIAKSDPESFEILRVWIAQKGQHVSLLADIWDDPAAWGLVLADLARHVANAYKQRSGRETSHVLQRISAAFFAELEAPTDLPSGKVQ